MQVRSRAYLRILLRAAVAGTLLISTAQILRAEEPLGTKIKEIFKGPTPTPSPRKKKKKNAPSSEKEKKPSPTPTPTASPKPKSKQKASPTPKPTETPEPSATPASKSKRHKKVSPTPTPSETPSTPSPTASPTPTPESSASVTPTPSAVAAPDEKKKGAPATIAPAAIADYEKYPTNVRKITDLALDLAGRNLQYKYGSADPANGGMDCSGFVYYVLKQYGVADVPRDSSQQYVWLRKAGKFRAVNSRQDDTFELNEMTPGDVLFWTGTYSIERDPPITHAMIYLGREKGTNKRIMVGASDGRSYNGEARFGVSVFDFKMSDPPRDKDAKLTPRFIGYAHVPGVHDG